MQSLTRFQFTSYTLKISFEIKTDKLTITINETFKMIFTKTCYCECELEICNASYIKKDISKTYVKKVIHMLYSFIWCKEKLSKQIIVNSDTHHNIKKKTFISRISQFSNIYENTICLFLPGLFIYKCVRYSIR